MHRVNSIGTDLWLPLKLGHTVNQTRRDLSVIVRLAAGSSVDEIEAVARTLVANLDQELPDDERGWGVRVMPLAGLLLWTRS